MGEPLAIDKEVEVCVGIILRCTNCGYKLNRMDEHCFVDTKRSYCQTCADQLLTYCNGCRNYMLRKEGRVFNGLKLCPECVIIRIKTCRICKNQFESLDNRRVRCDNCILAKKRRSRPHNNPIENIRQILQQA